MLPRNSRSTAAYSSTTSPNGNYFGLGLLSRHLRTASFHPAHNATFWLAHLRLKYTLASPKSPTPPSCFQTPQQTQGTPHPARSSRYRRAARSAARMSLELHEKVFAWPHHHTQFSQSGPAVGFHRFNHLPRLVSDALQRGSTMCARSVPPVCPRLSLAPRNPNEARPSHKCRHQVDSSISAGEAATPSIPPRC